MRPSAIVAEAYASGKIKLFEFLIDATQMPVILQENYGFRYILQKMNFTFQPGEIYTKSTFMRFSIISIFTFQHGEIYTVRRFVPEMRQSALHSNMERFILCVVTPVFSI